MEIWFNFYSTELLSISLSLNKCLLSTVKNYYLTVNFIFFYLFFKRFIYIRGVSHFAKWSCECKKSILVPVFTGAHSWCKESKNMGTFFFHCVILKKIPTFCFEFEIFRSLNIFISLCIVHELQKTKAKVKIIHQYWFAEMSFLLPVFCWAHVYVF